MTRRVIIEADGGSRGNPGPAAYGALVRDAATGEVIAERGETIGIATNNVAEYSGLIAGLELAREWTPGASVEVRMDSKLVIEQMAGRWRIKHPDMKPLALQAHRLSPEDVVWTWVPRERNAAADALANAALDAQKAGRPGLVGTGVDATGPSPTSGHPVAPEPEPSQPVRVSKAAESAGPSPAIGWRGDLAGDPMTLILLRHGVTHLTLQKLFSGSGGEDPALTGEGRRQAQRAAEHLLAISRIDAVVTSPLRRAQETADLVGHTLGLEVEIERGLAEASFGDWEGRSFADIMDRWPVEMDAWLSSTDVAPPGGESFGDVAGRVEDALDRLLERYAGRTVVAVSHVTPIKLLVRAALDAPISIIHRMELAPASLTTIAWWPDGTPSLRTFSHTP